jgi:hypothetical protein
MALFLLASDFDLVSKLISWGFHSFMGDKTQLISIPANAKLICKDEATGQLFVKTKQEYVESENFPKIMILYEVLIEDGFDWDKAIAQAIGMEEAPEDPSTLIQEIKLRGTPHP